MVDLVIVGAGLAGLSVAAAIANRRQVLVVDRLAPGTQASAQNAGMLRRMGEDPYERALAIRTHALLRDREALRHVSRQVGAVLAFGRDRHHLNDAAAHLAAVGVPHAWTDAPGRHAAALVGSPVLGGWVLPEERVVDAWMLVDALKGAVLDRGGRLARGSVTALRPRPHGFDVHLGPDVIPAREVVLAAGAWSASLARGMGLERPLFPLRRSLVHTRPHGRSVAEEPWCWVDDEGVYVRPEGQGWLLSGCDEAVDFPRSDESRGPVEAFPLALAMEKMSRWFPALEGLQVASGWSGLRTFAPDRRPLLGADPDVPALWWVAGLGGFGVSCGLAAGEAVATWIGGDEVTGLSRKALSPGRPMLRRWMVRPSGDLAGAVPIDGLLPADLGG